MKPRHRVGGILDVNKKRVKTQKSENSYARLFAGHVF